MHATLFARYAPLLPLGLRFASFAATSLHSFPALLFWTLELKAEARMPAGIAIMPMLVKAVRTAASRRRNHLP